MEKYNRFLPLVLICIILGGCSTLPKDQYYWGEYENLIQKMYVNAGKATPEVQVETIAQDIQKAESTGKPIAPGVYAHLGFMYSLQGNNAAANDAFNQEMLLYNDSKTLINGMLQRAKAASQQ